MRTQTLLQQPLPRAGIPDCGSIGVGRWTCGMLCLAWISALAGCSSPQTCAPNGTYPGYPSYPGYPPTYTLPSGTTVPTVGAPPLAAPGMGQPMAGSVPVYGQPIPGSVPTYPTVPGQPIPPGYATGAAR